MGAPQRTPSPLQAPLTPDISLQIPGNSLDRINLLGLIKLNSSQSKSFWGSITIRLFSLPSFSPARRKNAIGEELQINYRSYWAAGVQVNFGIKLNINIYTNITHINKLGTTRR